MLKKKQNRRKKEKLTRVVESVICLVIIAAYIFDYQQEIINGLLIPVISLVMVILPVIKTKKNKKK